jgi:hypothetical protein
MPLLATWYAREVFNTILGTSFLCAVFWLTILYFIGFVSGWHKLSRRFRSDEPFQGVTVKWTSATMGHASFDHMLNLGGNKNGFAYR